VPHTALLFGDEARDRLVRGASALADAVRLTLGPRSKSVLIEQAWDRPIVCDDGVTIAKRLRLKDAQENLGVQVLRQAAERTGDEVGDGTTTSTLLAHALLIEGVRNVVAGASAIGLKRGLEAGTEIAIDALRTISRPLTTAREREQVATVSAHNDPEIGSLVAQAIERVGAEGVVSVEEARGIETAMNIVEGLQFDRGFLSPYFVTNPARMLVELERPYILLTDRRVANIQDLIPLLEELVREGRPLLVIAEDVEGEALAILVLNRLRGTLLCAAVKAPGFGDQRKELLRDIATVSDGQLISEDLGRALEGVTIADLGRAERVVIDKDSTTIVGGAGDHAAVEARCEELRRRIEQATSDYDRERFKGRLAKLAGGVAVIRVGAHSESELKRRKEAFEDAISATQAAIAEGIVPGGGVAFVRMACAVEQEAGHREGDARTAFLILAKALEVPTRQIALNSDVDPGVVVDRIRSGEGAFGFDAAASQYCDLLEAGIVDAAKVVRVALQNAVSVAGTLLLAEATLSEVKDEKDERQPTEFE
jgi:chaperonin GroEL